jgi:hypothetical protein
MYYKLKLRLAAVSVALAISSGATVMLDLLLSRVLPIFAFLNTTAFALVCLHNVANGAGVNPYYVPVSLTIFWYGLGLILSSLVVLVVSVGCGVRVVSSLRSARRDVLVEINKLTAATEAAELQEQLKKDDIQKLLSAYHWVFNALRLRGEGIVATSDKSKIYREALARNTAVNGCLDCEYMRCSGPYRTGENYCVPEWQCAHPRNWEGGKEQFSFQSEKVLVAIPQWTDNPNCPRHKNKHGE